MKITYGRMADVERMLEFNNDTDPNFVFDTPDSQWGDRGGVRVGLGLGYPKKKDIRSDLD